MAFLWITIKTHNRQKGIDKDEQLHSGDVGTILPETQDLKIIDRNKNIFKLQKVALEKVQLA